MFRIAGLAVLAETTEELVEQLDGVWWELGLAPASSSDDEMRDSSFSVVEDDIEGEAEADCAQAVLEVSELDLEIQSLQSDIEECIRQRIAKFSKRLEGLRQQMMALADDCRVNCTLLQLPEGLVDQIIDSLDTKMTLTVKMEKLRELEAELEVQLAKRRAHARLLKEQLRGLCYQLGKRPEDMFPDIFGEGAASDVSLERVHQLQMAMEKADVALVCLRPILFLLA